MNAFASEETLLRIRQGAYIVNHGRMYAGAPLTDSEKVQFVLSLLNRHAAGRSVCPCGATVWMPAENGSDMTAAAMEHVLREGVCFTGEEV